MSKFNVNDELLEYLCSLSMLNIRKDDYPRFRYQIQKILDYMAMLDEVKTEGVTPMFGGIEFPPITRLDLAHETLTRSEAVANAPQEKEGLFSIPKVIE